MPRTGLTSAEIKDRAVAATIVRMRADGFDKVRLIDVAKELGVSHAALYAHFADKSALLDAVSERWLIDIDASLEAVCRKPGKDPAEKIVTWMITLHRAKVSKIMNDPELYKSFDLQASATKPYVQRHMATMRGQLVGLMQEAITKRRLRDADADAMAVVMFESLMSFHHPRLVAQHIGEKREQLLRLVAENVLRGLRLVP